MSETRRGYPDTARPIVVQEAHLEGEALQAVDSKVRIVHQDDMVGWCNGALPYVLGHEIKVEHPAAE
jgi:hypothetical protein